MGIGKKIFLMPCIFFAIFFTVNINAGQEFNKWFEQDEDQQSTIVNAKCKDQNTNFRIAETQTRIKTQNPAASAIFPSNKRGEGCVQSEIQNLSSTTIGNQQFKISTIHSTPQHAQMNKDEFIQKTQKLRMPFIANDGQLDEKVKFYAKTFAGSVFVTKDGEIVYSLPKFEESPSADTHSTEITTKSHRRRGIVADAQQGAESVRPVGWVEQGKTHQNGLNNGSVSPLERGEQGVCNMLQVSPETRETHPQPLLIEGSYGQDETQQQTVIASEAKQSPFLNPKSEIKNSKSIALKEEFVGGKISEIKGESQSVTKVNYFKGNDPSQWKTNISTYDVVDLGEVYEGINLKLKAYGNNVEKLFYVRPDADPDTIKVKLIGAKALRINEHDELVAETELGTVKFTKPIAYQEIDGKKVEVAVEYLVEECEVRSIPLYQEGTGVCDALNTNPLPGIHNSALIYGFKVASYDKNHDLIIDPLLASTYLGGGQADVPNCITLDNDGNIYVAGWTGLGFPATSDAYDTSNNGGYGSCDSFLAKLSGDLTQLLAATYLGGSSIEFITSIVIDKEKNVFVSGYTGNGSPEFPTTEGAVDTSWNGGRYTLYNGFISKFNEDLTQLIASTYLGGSGYDGDYLKSMAIDQNGNIYVTGDTDSRDFPISTSAYDTSNNGQRDGFISKLNGDLSAVLASTYLGGSNIEQFINGITIDSEGNIYVVGATASSDFPTTENAFDTTYNGYGYYYYIGDAFVSKLKGNLSELLASTLLGGTKSEYANSVAIDRSGNIYVAGWTHSSDFPVSTDAYDTYFDGDDGGNWEYPKGDVFISKLSNDLKELLNSTYLGGFSNDSPGSITIDSVGNIYVVGSTNSSDFPTTADAFEVSFGGSSNNDGFISKLNRYLTALLTSTYLGGDNSEDSVNAIAIKSTGDIYVAGHTMSSGFSTTTDAYDTSFNGSVFIPYWGTYGDAFVSRFYLPTSGCNDTELFITNIMPESGGDTGSVTMLISGCNFSGSTTVKLARDDQLDIKAEPVNVSEDGNSLYATFDLEGKERGVWDVVVTNPDDSSVTKEDAFTIEEGKTGDIWLDIVSRNAILIGRPQKFDILLTNSGNTDTVGAVLFGGIPKGTTIDLSPYYSLDLLLDDSDAVPEICENEDEMGVLFPTVTILTGFTKIVASFYLTIPTGEAHSMIELFASLGDD